MRYIVIGAGAVGGTIGGRLFQAGREVLLVARGAHRDALARDGLRLLTPEGEHRLDVPVADGPVRLRGDDVLVLAVKSQDTVAALEPWPRHAPVVCAQNGVANERMALRRFARVYGMCVWLPALHLEPGTVAAYGAPKSGLLQVGRYPGGTDELSERFAADLSASGFLGLAVPDVMRWKYAKLVGNLGNAYDALCGDWTGSDPVMERVFAEGRAVLDAAGIAYASMEEERGRRGDQVEPRPVGGAGRGGGSSWQSLARSSGSIETDYLNGEIVLLGRELGVPTPANEVLQREAGRFAREHLPPGSMSPQELAALVDAALADPASVRTASA
ncbi:ketopantoate reductase family protein [Planomonospora parontospora]|uniref:ketopantoate reductase family protein n=1 Tax=Planomonospora parontospora TaxID=58119 RepID=UPI001670C25D|nr:ketopantoate reductase family protein [Planomonospora parontospora]GGL30631.1 2-dehydropantoate 2-reductase [Planomonospora parontospora subsp. antibiotica]GII16693.1 2-dehydropantoate 2-reductase [Planomonospora parontospora subsp. antibiotica]